MPTGWTPIQMKRLRELNANEEQQNGSFPTSCDRNRAFQELEDLLVRRGKQRLDEMRNSTRRPALCRLESQLTEALIQSGFVQVITPTILSKGLLAKMSVTEDHPLAAQVFWLGENKCLRPMLAPNLYFILKDLIRIWEKPVRIFEVGSCFRKESQGAIHLSEFTMLDLVEMGLSEEDRQQHLEQFTAVVMEAAGIRDYRLSPSESEIYGTMTDIEAGVNRIEVGSAAIGPHSLDRAWGIVSPWVGIGFGLERLLMARENTNNLKSLSKSLAYLDGVRLNI